MTVFHGIEAAPPDAILGLTEAFKKDERDEKVNLGVGVYQDEHGITSTLQAVVKAEVRILEQPSTKSYMPMAGDEGMTRRMQSLLFGSDHAAVAEGRVRTAHTPGGTGGLRVGGDLIHQHLPSSRIWVSNPTWANHKGVFGAAGLEIKTYPYYRSDTKDCDFDAMMEHLQQVPAGDVVLLHVCCHNPTGVDLTPKQWGAVATCAEERGWLPFLDFAYQGFGQGLEEDRAPVTLFADAGLPFLMASSCSKNFGLYCERTGAFTVVAEKSSTADIAFSHVKKAIRANYSNPPAHGGHIVRIILEDPELTTLWKSELVEMRERIHHVRAALVQGLVDREVQQDFSFIRDQQGMFSFSGLSDAQVEALREQHGIYVVQGGRINVAGLTPKNLDRVCDAFADVVRSGP